MRSLVLINESSLLVGEYVFIARDDLLLKSFSTLQKDYQYAMKKMGLIKN